MVFNTFLLLIAAALVWAGSELYMATNPKRNFAHWLAVIVLTAGVYVPSRSSAPTNTRS